MDAKMKAVGLVDKFYDLMAYPTMSLNGKQVAYNQAKKQALICVDEIIKVLDEISISESGTTKIDYGQSFYNEVKNEISKL